MDYANRKRPPAKKKPTAKSAKTSARNAAAPVSWQLVVITLALVAGLVWFLYSIAGSKNKQPVVQQPLPEVTDKMQQQMDKAGIPELPKDQYSYPDVLQNQEVEVDVPEREVGPPKLMQCGSFRRETDAQTLRARIALTGLEAQVRRSEGRNGVWYRVILGPYVTKREAERDRHKLQRAQIHYCEIWNWNL